MSFKFVVLSFLISGIAAAGNAPFVCSDPGDYSVSCAAFGAGYAAYCTEAGGDQLDCAIIGAQSTQNCNLLVASFRASRPGATPAPTPPPVRYCPANGDFTVPCTSFGIGYAMACLKSGADSMDCNVSGPDVAQQCIAAGGNYGAGLSF